MERYKKLAFQIISEGTVRESDIYFYDGNRLQPVFDAFFNWCKDDLEIDNVLYQLPNAAMIYIDDYDVNAFAMTSQPRQLIGIYRGLMENMFYVFWDNSDIFRTKESFKLIAADIALSEDDPMALLFQFFTYFIYFHELAHLLQSRRSDFPFVDEKFSDTTKDDNLIKQLREYDADNLGAVQIFIQSCLRYAKVPSKDKSPQVLESYITIGIVSIFTYFLQSSRYHNEIYYEGKSHPHPLVRLFYTMDSIQGCFQANREELGSPDFTNIFSNVSSIAREILSYDIFSIYPLVKNQGEAIKRIQRYSYWLQDEALKNKDLTLNFFLGRHMKRSK